MIYKYFFPPRGKWILSFSTSGEGKTSGLDLGRLSAIIALAEMLI